jgi:hypothetical protein
MAKDGYVTVDEAIAHIMRVTGKNRRQARAALREKWRSGEVPVFGTNNQTGNFEVVPPPPPALSPAEAAERLARDPAGIGFAINDVMDLFHMTEAELLAELRSGRLIAHGEPLPGGGYKHVTVRGDRLLEWMVANGRHIPTEH